MSTFLPARWLVVLPALAAFASGAQTDPAPSSAVVSETASAPRVRSAMEGYKPFTEEKPASWKEANETVRRRGGWQAYANEDAAASDPHAGHAMPKPPAPTPKKDKQ